MEKRRAIELLKLAVPIKALTQQEYSDFVEAVNMGINALEQPTIQPEPSIPLSWIEKEIEWLKSLDNTFSEITALQISAMVLKWKDEKK